MDFEMLDFDMEALPSPTAPAPAPAPTSAPTTVRAPTLVSSPSPMAAPAPTSRPPVIGAPTGPADLYEMEMIGAEVVNQDDADPLETKLSLAAEFLTIGDTDAARSLAEEVFDEATGALKKKANKFLSDMA
jgi:pilus assembly protein FimV